jgi:hypothetical protein
MKPRRVVAKIEWHPGELSTTHFGFQTTFQSCQRLAMGAVSAEMSLSSCECRLKPENEKHFLLNA